MWGHTADVRFQYSAALTDIAHTIDASPDTSPVAVSSYFIEDADPIIFAETLNRHDVAIRWFDARESIIAAAGATTQRLGVPSFTPLDATLNAEFLNGAEPITSTKDFKLYAFDAAQFRQKIEAWTCAACPVTFDQAITLLGLQTTIADKTLIIQSAWRVEREGQPALTEIFMHLIGTDGRPAAQDDRLGVPRHTWQVGDEFVQVHRIALANLPPGQYPLELGIYNRGTRPVGRRRISRAARWAIISCWRRSRCRRENRATRRHRAVVCARRFDRVECAHGELHDGDAGRGEAANRPIRFNPQNSIFSTGICGG